MKELNSAQMGTSGGSIARLPRPISFPDGRACSRLRAEATIVVKQTNAVAQNLTGASVKAILACLFDTSTLRFGDRSPEIVDASIPYARAREQFVAMTGDDFLIQAAGYNGGAPKRVRDVADADVIAAALAQNATTTIVVEFSRAFEVSRLGQDAYAYTPGATQMKQIQWEFVRGSTFEGTGNFVQNAAADLLFIADDVEDHDDKWAAVPRIYQQEESGRVSHGPAGSIGLIAMWDYTGVGATTPLTLFTIARKDDAPLQDNVQASRVVRGASYTDPIGGYDVNGLCTVLHNMPADAEKQDIPVGAGFTFQQTGTELNPARTAWLHVPVRTEEEIDALVGENVKDVEGVKLISAAAKSGKGLSSAAASLEPVILARRGTGDFEALPGRVHGIGLVATTHVPESILGAVNASVASATGAEGKAAAADKASKVLGKAIPGWLPGRRGKRSAAMAGFRSRIAGK